MEEEESKPPFRMNQQMLAVLAVVLLLLVVPLSMLGYFFYDILRGDESRPGAEVSPALEQMIEKAAESAFPQETDLARTLPVSQTVITSIDRVANAAERLGGDVVFRLPEEDGFGRILVRIPESQAATFEAAMASGEPVPMLQTPVPATEERTIFEVILEE